MAERIFRGFLFLGRRIFPRIFSPDFFFSFLWEKVPRKSSRKILQKLYAKNPRHISAEGPGQEKFSDVFALWVILVRNFSQTEFYPVQSWSLAMLQEPSTRPQPKHWITFLDPGPWVQDFYPVSDLFSHVLFSFLPPLLATPVPLIFSTLFGPFLPFEKCSFL